MSMVPDPPLGPPSGRRNSLRLRFGLAILLWVALGIGGIGFSASRLFAKHVEEQYHEELTVHIDELAGLMAIDPDGHIRLTRPLSDPRYQLPLSGYYWQISLDPAHVLKSGSMTKGGLNPEIAHSPHVDHVFEPGPTGTVIAYGMTRQTPQGQRIHLVIATDRRLLDETIGSFTRELTLWLIALGAALAGTGLAIIAFGLHPLDRLTGAVAMLRRGETDHLAGNYPFEVAPLVDELNGFIDHNRKSLTKARVEAANLAHALRTPLAIITDEAERLAKDAATASSAQVLLDQARAMAQQTDYHLARTRSAAGTRLPGTTSPLPQTLTPLLSAMAKLHPDVAWDLQCPAGLATSMAIDPVDLSELLSNLLDNAGKWANSRVQITITSGKDGAAITIADDGPGMTAEQIALSGEIGRRFDEAKPGSGLGLAIARDIAASWELELTMAAGPNGGLVVRLLCPVA